VQFCVDVSAVLAKIIPDQTTEPILEFWARLTLDDAIVVPALLYPECTSVLRSKVAEGILDEPSARAMLHDVLALPLRVVTDVRQFDLAFDIATKTGRRTAYDMQYVAVAVLERCEMVTLDGGVYQAAREQRINARLSR
jgi:predicted nucleic acid-binding protein